MIGRTSHTTKQGRAKCLHYRQGVRCGRVARYEVQFTDHQGAHHIAVCKECANRISARGPMTILNMDNEGFMVDTFTNLGGMTRRTYRNIKPNKYWEMQKSGDALGWDKGGEIVPR